VNEQQLRRLFRRFVVLSAPLPLAVLGAACGGSSIGGEILEEGSSGSGGSGGGVHEAGTTSGGANAGTGTVAGGSGGASAGAGGSSAGTGGAPLDCKASPEMGACTPIISTLPRPCLPEAQAVVGTPLPAESCRAFCNESFAPCSVSAVEPTTVSVMCRPGCAIGRRPAGLAESPACDRRAAGDYFAEIAHLEAASVTAFRVLRDELRAHRAPKKLLRAAARAARDEIRHTRSTRALARRFGGTPREPMVEKRPLRSVEAMAIENAVEGCVRETYGALLATRQAELARDPHVRAAMMRIARDETQHAALSWRVARFLDAKLDPQARRNVEHAKRAAARELLSSLASEPALGFADLAGLPSPSEATQLATEMNRALWS
jgi:hypothetical protein